MTQTDQEQSKSVYITILGRSIWALVNSYYAVLQETSIRSEKIIVVSEEQYNEHLDAATEAISCVGSTFDCESTIESMVATGNFNKIGGQFFKLVQAYKQDNWHISIDVTPGRKSLVTAALIPAVRIGVDHIFYLDIASLENAAKPYMMLPLRIQHLRDFMEEYRRRNHDN